MQAIHNGSITSPDGFTAAAAACGLKESGALDLALVVSQRDCAAAGVFTQNKVVAAPVIADRETLAANGSKMRAVVCNAGNANACTGARGLAAARDMQALTAQAIGCAPGQVFVLSTGVIGQHLPMDKIAAGIAAARDALNRAGGGPAARAIMTTDTHPKQFAVQAEIGRRRCALAGMAKGSGMIHPNMATMLAVLTTDAAVPRAALQPALHTAVEKSFNRISIDGDTSTNDTVLLLANGASGVSIESNADMQAFQSALDQVCVELAKMIVRDGEGATRFVNVHVSGAQSEQDARAVADTIATSPLVKTAFAGGDANWGRLMMAAGRSGAELDQDKVNLWIAAPDSEPLQLVENGGRTEYAEPDAAAIFAQPEFNVQLDLGLGAAGASIWTCDLTHEYVSINADYRT